MPGHDGARVGNQQPTYSWCASWTRTEGRLAASMADAYGIPPHPWQRTVLDDWLALDDDGRLLNSLCLLPVPRQNGKTGVCDPRETWGIVYRCEHILHTAQEYQTAKKAFDRLREKFGERRDDPRARFPELNALVRRYTTSANQMVLDLKNGAHIEFRTRGVGGDVGRGGTFDLVVVDEAQSFTDAQASALDALNSAAPHGSPQTILMGTVPEPTQAYKGERFAALRSSLHASPYAGACIHEWGAPEPGDVADVARWYEYNPSLGYQLLESGLLKDSRTMSRDAFAREHLGWWPSASQAADAPIRAADWAACADAHPEKAGVPTYSVKFSSDGGTGTLAVCWRDAGSAPFVYVASSRGMSAGLGWFEDVLAARWADAAQVVVDGQSNAQALIDRLLARRVPSAVLLKPRSGDVIAACSSLANAVRERRVRHYGQPALDASATKSGKRRIGGNGGWGFRSADGADATLIEACALAYWGAMTTKRDPRRKGRAGC